MRHPARLSWSIFAATTVVFAAAVAVASRDGRALDVLTFAPVMLSFASVGALVAGRHPANAVGWLFLGEGVVGAVLELTGEVATLGASRHPHPAVAAWAGWAFTVLLPASLLLLILSLLVFPDGRLASRRWRPVAVGTIAASALSALASVVADVNFANNFPGLRDPVRIVPRSVANPLFGAAQGVLPALFVVAAVGLVLRMRRRRGEERAQLKWVAYATALTAIALFVTAAFPLGIEPVVAFVIVAPLIPVAAGVAILRYRLYDVDVVISRTVAYGALATFVTVVYVGIVALAGSAIGHRYDRELSIAATAAVAIAFQPVRERLQRAANRLVYGRRATPYEVMAGFGRRVSGTLSVEEVLPGMAEVAARGIGGERAWVRLLLPNGEREVAWPPGDEAPPDGRVTRAIEVRYQGEPIGAIAVVKPDREPITPAEDKLLGDLAAQAGLAFHNVRLTEELERRLEELARRSAELQVSRERLVTARDAQRRGLERDIREGPQRELRAIGRSVREAADRLDDDPDAVEATLDRLGEHATGTLEGLRDLARGIFPPLLAEKGVVAALEAHVRKVGAHAEVRADPAFASRRFDDDVEACVYFCCLQAIQNVLRHAGNAPATVRLELEGDVVTFAIEDEGPGFDVDATSRGMGLQIMQDRVDAFDGTLDVESSSSRTTVTGRIPAGIVEEAVR